MALVQSLVQELLLAVGMANERKKETEGRQESSLCSLE